ncbi:MAG: hybrid sensor histidine kinase/response regulator [Opitutales bacterium]|nr:hybrid sensor histidine kinase/response regulator [Opitutales bacterium]
MVDNELIGIFIQESKEHLEAIEPEILAMESASHDSEGVNTIFRGVHSIKGSSGFFGFDQISKLSHVMENLMALVRDGQLSPNSEMVSVLLASTDKLKLMIDDPQHCAEVAIEDEVKQLNTFLPAAKGGTKPAQGKGEPAPKQVKLPDSLKRFRLDPYILKNAMQHGHLVFVIRLFMNKDVKEKGRTPYDYFKEIESLGEFVDAYFDFSSISGLDDALSTDLVCSFLFTTVMGSPDMITSVFDIPASQVEEIEAGVIKEWLGTNPGVQTPEGRDAAVFLEVVEDESGPASDTGHEPDKVEEEDHLAPTDHLAVKASSAPAARMKVKRADETIRVNVSLLDSLMNLAGEMVLSRNQLIRIAENHGQEIAGLQSIIQNINLVTSDMHEKVMQTRLQALGIIFGKFTRIIRDLAMKLGKEIILDIEGEDVELDKSIVEALSDPLTHLIRNCADHGIELPEERERMGKPREGRVRLTAKHVGGQVLIEIIDDGRGMNPEKLRQKAIEKGVLKAEEAAKMSDRQALTIIFLPGFSTAEKVSDVSGRGVGMDVVRTNIEGLGGFVDIDSEVGVGTRISLRLPLTLAIIPAMIVGSCGRRFAVPQVNLEEVVRLGGKNKPEIIRGSRVLRLRDSLLTLINLADVLEIAPQEGERGGATDWEDGYVLVLNVDNNQYGLIVSELLDSEEIAVKPLSVYLKQVGCYSGVTIMGDGKVAMIVDIQGIATMARLKFAENEINEQSALDLANQLRSSDSESLLLFRNEGLELFAINLSTVARIERIKASDIEHIGKGEYLKLGGRSLRLVRMHDYMPIAKPEQTPQDLYVLVPKLLAKPIGIVATQIVDTVQTVVDLDRETISGVGILGSTFINNALVLLVDIYSLFESVDPEVFRPAAYPERFKQLRALLVDNNVFFRTVEGDFLRRLFGEVVDVRNAAQAWEKLSEENFHVVISDVELPGTSGFDLCGKVRHSERHKHLPFIGFSARQDPNHEVLAKETMMDAYQMKFDKVKLLRLIESIFDRKTPRLTQS